MDFRPLDNRHGSNIYLVGFSGSGKSTVAPLVATRLGMTFVEMDTELVTKAGQGIPTIFATCGEDYFRNLETDLLGKIATNSGQVVATGGGIIVRCRNIKLMRDNGLVVHLQTSTSDLLRRLKLSIASNPRPLLGNDLNKENLHALIAERAPLYARAHVTVDTSGKTVATVAKEIVDSWSALRHIPANCDNHR